jgi:hypothetical protein
MHKQRQAAFGAERAGKRKMSWEIYTFHALRAVLPLMEIISLSF